MTADSVASGLLILAISLFSAFSAIYIFGLTSQKRRIPGTAAEYGPPGQPRVPLLTDLSTPPETPSGPAPFLDDLVDHMPILAWRIDASGLISWANRAYLDTLARLNDGSQPKLPPFESLFHLPETLSISGRYALSLPDRKEAHWFDISSCKASDGSTLMFAYHADPVVKAEEALRNFVQTLTKTFAHLPIGLAVFDRKRRLALFNPALSDLTLLEPAWLSEQPTLVSFLDKLRETGQLPEPKDYKSWREKFIALERAAEHGTYEETWTLPTGQTYRVTGRPHPEGAVAFLFEDISSEIGLQRQFRAELELGQSLIDAMPSSVAVFSSNGDLVMTNDAFAAFWGIDPREMLARYGADQAILLWKDACGPHPVWVRLAQYARDLRDREDWSEDVPIPDGLTLRINVTPLRRGAFQVSMLKIAAISDGARPAGAMAGA